MRETGTPTTLPDAFTAALAAEGFTQIGTACTPAGPFLDFEVAATEQDDGRRAAYRSRMHAEMLSNDDFLCFLASQVAYGLRHALARPTSP